LFLSPQSKPDIRLLISEPLIGDPSKIIQAVKLSVSRRLAIGGEFSGRFWQSRFYDFNLWGQQKEIEKLKANNRFPAPNVIGNIFSQKASTKSCFMSV